MAAPAAAWQRDLAPADGARGGATQQDTLTAPLQKFQDIEQLSKTFAHVADVSKEFRRDAELHDLLASTSKEDTYQQHFQAWPSLLRPLSPAILELPTMVQDKYRACQAMCFCGLFPQIRRAWASVDNSLFLWRYDRSSDVPIEYCGEDQAISCVGLAAPRPGVFLPAIQHVIVLCTTAEIVLLGVCPARRGGGGAAAGPSASDPDGAAPDEILLQPLPLYSIPTDNVVITCVASGVGGRVFLGGADGHVYELTYHAADTWRHKRISKVRLTSGLQQYLPSFVPALLGLGAPAPIERLCVDTERHVLYALNAASGLQVFDLGAYGNEPARRVAEVSNVYAAAAGAVGGRELFRGASADRKGAAVKYIAPIATSESAKLHLMAVTADGRRIYFTTHHASTGPHGGYSGSYGSTYGSGSGAYGSSTVAAGGTGAAAGTDAAAEAAAAAAAPGVVPFPRRPETLMAVFARAALPHAGVARGPAADLTRSAALEIVAAHYSAGCLLLSESAGAAGGGGAGATKLLAASRNTTLPPATINTHTGSGYGYGGYGYGGYGGGSYGYGYGGFVAGGLRESVTELDNFVPGETCAVEAAPCRPALGPEVLPPAAGPGGDELASAVWWPPPRFALIGTAGVVELEKRRPVELLLHILERNSQEQLRSFFQAYGAVESAAMCYMVATAGPPGALAASLLSARGSGALGGAAAPYLAGSAAATTLGGGGVSALAARAAAAALENPLLVGEARMPEDAAPADGAGPGVAVPGAGGNGMYMGRAVDPNPGPAWSAGHRGLCLYASRLLAPVYDKKVAVAAGGKAGGSGRVLTCRFSTRTLEALEDRLTALAAFLEVAIARRQQKGYATRAAVVGGGGGLAGAAGVAAAGSLSSAQGALPLFGGGGGLFGGQVAGGGAPEDPMAAAHKRRRLEHASQREDEMAQRIRALVLRAAEACALLRLLSAHNLGRLALRQLGGSGAADMARLTNLTLRSLVQESDGETVAAKLISGLVNEQLDLGLGLGLGGGAGAGAGAGAIVPVAGAGASAAGAEAVAAALQAAAPSYFRQEDRVYYQASALLKAAEAAAGGPEREAAVRQAVALLLRVPLVVHLESLVNQLANLKHYEGIVTVPLAAANARDPDCLALRPELGAACEAARQRRREAYSHLFGVLRAVLDPAGGAPGGAAAGGGAAGGAAALSAAERAAFKAALFKAALSSSDSFFLDELYGFVIGTCGAAEELLSRDAPGLESYLAREGGLLPATTAASPLGPPPTGAAAAAALSGGSPVGPLTAGQVALLELLARMLVGKGRFQDAALVHGALACRRSGPGPELAVPLRARVAALQSAVLHARSAGDQALVSRLDSDAQVVGFQAAIAERLQARRASLAASASRGAGAGPSTSAAAAAAEGSDAAATVAELDRALGELSGAPLELSVLYNSYAQPYGLWDVCLQMIRFAGGGGGGAADPAAVVRTLWDHELLRAYDARRDSPALSRLADACDAVAALGPSLHPDQLTLPLPHVAWRLEAAAAGLWPAGAEGGAAAEGERASDLIVTALMAATCGSAAAVRRVYEALLSRRGGGVGVGGGGGLDAALSSVRVKTQLLRSAAAVCSAALSELRAAAPAGLMLAGAGGGAGGGVGRAREAGALADAADRFALEARRLGGPDCEEIARRLDSVRAEAELLR